MPNVGVLASSGLVGAVVPIAYFSATNTAGIGFQNIPNKYQDLMVVMTAQGDATWTGAALWPRINADTSAVYSFNQLLYNGSTYTAARVTGAGNYWNFENMFTNARPGTLIMYFPSYADTSKFKMCLARGSLNTNGGGSLWMASALYRSTNAINEITAFVAGGTGFSVGTAALYGIRSVGQ